MPLNNYSVALPPPSYRDLAAKDPPPGYDAVAPTAPADTLVVAEVGAAGDVVKEERL